MLAANFITTKHVTCIIITEQCVRSWRRNQRTRSDNNIAKGSDYYEEVSKQVSCHVHNCSLIVFSKHAWYVITICAVAQHCCEVDSRLMRQPKL